MFPKVRKTKLDLNALGEQMVQRRAELESQISSGDGADSRKRDMGTGRSRASTSPQY